MAKPAAVYPFQNRKPWGGGSMLPAVLWTCRLAVAAAFVAVLSLPARADAVSDFYAGKDVTFMVGGEPGGGYDTFARLVARHYAAHLPGHPNVIVKNMPGAGSMTMSNH